VVNFNKLKTLIGGYENSSELQKRKFFTSLKKICEIELNITQANLSEYFK
jgi:hypothetical protein